MIRPGLVSITFRGLPPERVVALAAGCGLRAIEWGGDIHVPHGDVRRAAEVARLTADAGLAVAAYGSYYRLGEPAGSPAFAAVLDSAAALGAAVIRVWAGKRGSAEADAGYRARVAADARESAAQARAAGVCLALEWHGGTLTDTTASAMALMGDLEGSGVDLYWQPPVGAGREDALAGLRAALPHLVHLHVFHWTAAPERRPLREGLDPWRAYLAEARLAPGERCAMLEFVRGDDPALLAADAAALIGLLEETT